MASDAPLALVYHPSQNPMQSGPRTKKWILHLQPQRPLHLEHLMGWTSGDDPSRQIRIEFRSREAAVDFAKARGWEFCILPENRRKSVVKSYRDNIVFNDTARTKSAGSDANYASISARKFDTYRASTEPQHEASNHSDQDWLDDALAATFPTSDPVALWTGHIGPPADCRK